MARIHAQKQSFALSLPKVESSFKKVKDLAPGKTEEVTFALDKYAVSYWDDIIHKWKADKGTHTVKIASSSENVESETTFTLEKGFEWSGL